jgi:hypothetical protein
METPIVKPRPPTSTATPTLHCAFPIGYRLLIRAAACLQSPLLLAIRLYWGWQFFLTGKGKLMNPEK